MSHPIPGHTYGENEKNQEGSSRREMPMERLRKHYKKMKGVLKGKDPLGELSRVNALSKRYTFKEDALKKKMK